MQCKDIDTTIVLEYLSERQGKWTQLWGYESHTDTFPDDDVVLSMPKNTPYKLALAKMKKLHSKGFVGGCPCGCRGDFEITDKGLSFIGKERYKKYTGYAY